MRVFETVRIGRLELRNRLLRSATFEAMCDAQGRPGQNYLDFYSELSAQGLGGIITGFACVSPNGRAMQAGQACIDSDDKVPAFRRVTEAVHRNPCRLFLQLAHAGRQTSAAAAGGAVYGASTKKSSYFRSAPRRLSRAQVDETISAFGSAARRAREAGFDGVQIHAAHGYLIHQFLDPAINDRGDDCGIDRASGVGTRFLTRVIESVRSSCGADFALLVKVSAGDGGRRPEQEARFEALIQCLDLLKVDAIEVSYGTMERALNIFRGGIPIEEILNFNPRYATRNRFKQLFWATVVLPVLRKRFIPYSPMYNLPWAELAARFTTIPVVSVGGFRTGKQIRTAIEELGIDFVSLCRPLICEPDFALKVAANPEYRSRCANCNRCAVMCDSGQPTRCYRSPAGLESQTPHPKKEAL